MINLAAIALGGAIGAVSRYLLAGYVHRFTPTSFPYGTFAVNVLGCLLFGVVIGVADQRFAIGATARAFLLIGVLGGFTTFSSFTFETFQLLRDAQFLWASLNVVGQIAAGMLALWIGYVTARGLW
jgi:fluoride exporter